MSTTATAPELAAIREHMIIDGQPCTQGEGAVPVHDPATGEIMARQIEAGPKQVDLAVAAARRAFELPSWRDLTPAERERLLLKPADRLEAEAIAMANDTQYDLGASPWTDSVERIQRMVPLIQAGTIWVNTPNMVDPNMPFGRVKQSGMGREHGRAAIETYLETKSVCVAYAVS